MATVVFTIHYVQGSSGKNGNDGNTGLIVSIIDIVTTYMYMYINIILYPSCCYLGTNWREGATG